MATNVKQRKIIVDNSQHLDNLTRLGHIIFVERTGNGFAQYDKYSEIAKPLDFVGKDCSKYSFYEAIDIKKRVPTHMDLTTETYQKVLDLVKDTEHFLNAIRTTKLASGRTVEEVVFYKELEAKVKEIKPLL